MGENRKEYALAHMKTEPNFGYVMNLANGKDLYETAKEHIREKTKRLMISRDWLQDIDPTLFFQDPEEDVEDN
jgi:hypothetical protein